eukprot:4069309-Ditylum_brightwellii.AAC.1
MSGLFASTTLSTLWVMSYVTNSWLEMSVAGFGLCFCQLGVFGACEHFTPTKKTGTGLGTTICRIGQGQAVEFLLVGKRTCHGGFSC